MSLVPFLLNDVLNELNRPVSIFDQNFGLGVLNDDLISPRIITVPLRSGYYRPWRHLATRNSGTSQLIDSNENFKVSLDVQQFKPDEVKVKVVDDYVVIEGKHEERKDEHGFISRQFCRRYKLPSDINLEALTSTLSSDGILQIQAPKKEFPKDSQERVIPITQSQQPAIAKGAGDQGEKMDQ